MVTSHGTPLAYGTQSFTCCKCMNHYCTNCPDEEAEDNEDSLISSLPCRKCKRIYCFNCQEMETCESCAQNCCVDCGDFKQCVITAKRRFAATVSQKRAATIAMPIASHVLRATDVGEEPSKRSKRSWVMIICPGKFGCDSLIQGRSRNSVEIALDFGCQCICYCFMRQCAVKFEWILHL